MIVRAVANTGQALPAVLLDPRRNLTRDSQFYLTVGQDYTVYAMTVDREHPWYYICDDVYDNIGVAYPIWQPAALFEIADPRVSRYWEFDYRSAYAGGERFGLFAFPEWAHDPSYYERLTDHDPRAIDTFRKYKRLMDEEAQESGRHRKDNP